MTEKAKIGLVILFILATLTSYMYIKGYGPWGPVIKPGSCHSIINNVFKFKLSRYDRKTKMYYLDLLHYYNGTVLRPEFIEAHEEQILEHFREIDCPGE